MGSISESLAEKSRLGPESHQSRRTGEAVPCGLPTSTMEKDRPMRGWRWLRELPGGSGTGGTRKKTQQGQRRMTGASLMRTGKGWGVAGAANMGGRRKYLEGCLPALCNTGHCHQSRGPNIVYPLSPTYFLSPLPPSLLPAFGVWGKALKSFLTLLSVGQKFKS